LVVSHVFCLEMEVIEPVTRRGNMRRMSLVLIKVSL
jgi:hypothetical protein